MPSRRAFFERGQIAIKSTVNSIIIKDLNVHYENKQVLKNICCELPKNKITVIIGGSGCGKSTLLKSINRIVEEEHADITGEIQIEGKNTKNIPKTLLRKDVGLVFQTPVIFPLSIKKNMLYPLAYHFELNEHEQSKKIKHYLEITGLYDEVKENLNMRATKLSGGQKQRLAVARSLCIEPKILMLDEPCSALDMKNTLIIEELLVKLKQLLTIVMVTHNLSQAKRIADYVLFIDNGKLIEANDVDIFENPKEELTKNYLQYMHY